MEQSAFPPTSSLTSAETARARSIVTIHDVARAAEVSVSTVSKALNNKGHLRAETRAQVIATARELAFRPNDLAQSLHRGHSMTVGLITTNSFGRFTAPIMQGIEERLSESAVALFMCNATDDPAREARHVEQLLCKRVDGLIVTARRADQRPKLKCSSDISVVYVFSQVNDPDACCVLPDDAGGAQLAVRHLAEVGRRRIAHITGPERFEAVALRRDGYRKALAEAGLAEPRGYYRPGVWSESWGRHALTELFHSRRPPDAIFCGNDQIARGVADALRERGVRAPDDVALVGFDNWEIIAAATRPPLTSVDINLVELGRQAGTRVLNLIAGARLAGVERLPCSLVVRQSCGAKGAQGGERRRERAEKRE